jgi:hypothetical protein
VTRLKLGLVALVALAASAFFATPALADTQPDPELTNIPYLAWRGEEVRLVKCDPDIFAGLDEAQRSAVAQSAQFDISFVDVLLVDWSGDPNVVKPQLEPGTVSMFFRSYDSVPCVAATVVSQKPGLAQFKLVVTANLSLAAGTPSSNVPEVITVKHDFNVAWMNINTATLGVVKGGTTDVAGGAGNQLQLLITGTIPLLENYGELGLGSSITMPADWPRLANAMATFQDPLNPSPAQLWDIHDEFSPTQPDPDLHGAQSICTHNTTLFVDTVDQCIILPNPPPGSAENTEFGQFSRIWQGFAYPTVGPFDPLRPQQTLLSNGTLDLGDAPMPSARVDFAIAPNSGAPTDISGVGSLSAVDKHVVYSRNGLGNALPHNLYGPFNLAWLPPAAGSDLSFLGAPFTPPLVVPEASGITGPLNLSQSAPPVSVVCGHGNNFNGFLAGCLYHYWDFAMVLGCGATGQLVQEGPFQICVPTPATPTGCLPVVFRGFPTGADQPFLIQKVVTYSDEHGEVRVNFLPGVNFFFTHLPGVAINSNGGCDLRGVSTLGTANIAATVRYPFEPVTARPVVSNTVTKTVTSAFSKTITCFPKGTQPVEHEAAICVAEAHDITGAPFVGETVCFTANLNAESIQPFPPTNPGIGTITTATPPIQIGVALDAKGNVIGPIPNNRNTAAEKLGTNRICMITDDNGRAAVEIFNSDNTTVNVIALFVDEGILRSLNVPFPITAQVGPSSAATSTSTSNGSAPTGGSNNGASGNNSSSGNNSNASTALKLKVVKLVRQSRTKATVILRVTGPNGKVPVRIRFSAAHKKAISSTHMVKTNKLVKLRNLRTPNAKRLTVKASLVS